MDPHQPLVARPQQRLAHRCLARATIAASTDSDSASPNCSGPVTMAVRMRSTARSVSPSACDTVFAAIARVRAVGVRVVYDATLRPKLRPLARTRAIIKETVANCDLFPPSLEDAELFTGLKGRHDIIDPRLRAVAPIPRPAAIRAFLGSAA